VILTVRRIDKLSLLTAASHFARTKLNPVNFLKPDFAVKSTIEVKLWGPIATKF